ncbi:DNA/RNA non-specific endonuclease [Longimicrobium sp.]|uniref:DNA/RNA non-specific endonuclease n=1 Tax=Longimicrobium sp. TaxID=2029185 RepID=UPI002E313295|nr:DNA/RNA non-specific endonuclease [Longimicrobium sp.]HEX6042757.1 DNA/RNA non-specific endonuclease [Longimicrobium sp.]
MSHFTLRAAGASVLALVLAACSSDQPTGAASSSARLDLQAPAAPGLVINEIMPNPAGVADELGEWFEIYNAGSTPVDLRDYRIASNNDAVHVINQSVVVPAGGYAVLARNGDPGVNGGVTAHYSYAHQTFNLNNSGTDWLALRAPDGATLDSVSWGTSSPPNGASRGVINPALDNTLMSGTGANWSTQTSVYGLGDKGTPGAANDGGTVTPPPPPPPVGGAVVINEILADPRAVADANGEWFEVRNRGTTPVSLQGWTIASGGDASHTIASAVSIPAGGYVVLGRDGSTATNGGVTLSYVYAGTTTLNLGNSSDWLALRDASGATLDSVAWTSTTAGTARALLDSAADNTNVNGAAWANATATFGAGDRGTPGLANTTVVDPGPGGSVASISLSINAPRQIPVGFTKPAFATARDGAGATVAGVRYTWTSSSPAVAEVDSLGYIRGLGEGTATISAAAPNGVAGTATITILPADAPTTAVYRNHVEFGTPEAQGVLVRRREYVSSYSAVRGGPNWVSWNINASQFGQAARCDCFSADETLPAGTYRVVDFDYRNGGYDRGHMVQSESRTATLQENAATFLMTNILPQAGENNQGPWVQFENYLNDLARQDGKEIYVVAGGEYTANPATLKNEGKVQVPAFTWKVAVILDGGEGLDDVGGYGDLQVLAIRMPNDTATARGIRNNPWQTYATTVDDIEQRTGYDLLEALPNGIERVVEANDRVPVAATDGPYVGIEGSTVTLSAAPSSDPDGDALTYAWSFGDGETGTGVSPTHVYADNGNYQVSVVVTDAYGAADTATTTVTVMNAAPTVAAFAGGALLRGETYAAAGSFGDAGAADTWTATVDYGDGGGARPLALDGTSFALSHRYTAAGTFTVTVRVTDDDGDTGTRTATVTVQSPAQAVGGLGARVDALVGTGALARGNGTALLATLRAATAALERGQGATAANQLGAFVNQVEALVQAGRLPQAQGAALTAAAQRIVESIQAS